MASSDQPVTQIKQHSITEQKSSELLMPDQFRTLFDADKNRLYSYIHAFMGNSHAADDIFQETCLTLWKEFAKFEIGTNFSKWANGIAFRRVLAYRRQNKKYALGISDEFLDEFQEAMVEFDALSAHQETKLAYLEHCRALLSPTLQQIYQHFYVQNQTAQEIADHTGRSIHAIRKAIHKMRQKIFDCVDDKEQEELE